MDITTDEIIQLVCDKYNVTKADMCSSKRHAKLTECRAVCALLLQDYKLMSTQEIGDIMNKHRTIVTQAKQLYLSPRLQTTVGGKIILVVER